MNPSDSYLQQVFIFWSSAWQPAGNLSAHQVELVRLIPLEVFMLINLLRFNIRQRAIAMVTTLPESIYGMQQQNTETQNMSKPAGIERYHSLELHSGK